MLHGFWRSLILQTSNGLHRDQLLSMLFLRLLMIIWFSLREFTFFFFCIAVFQGIDLIESFYNFLTVNKWDQKKFNFQSWLWLLVKIIDFKNNPQISIAALFSARSEVIELHKKSLTSTVSLLHILSISFCTGSSASLWSELLLLHDACMCFHDSNVEIFQCSWALC